MQETVYSLEPTLCHPPHTINFDFRRDGAGRMSKTIPSEAAASPAAYPSTERNTTKGAPSADDAFSVQILYKQRCVHEIASTQYG
mmetsp:Transcript_18928/g.34110  ORF Transcript_18928/g.34110 Transcript_18928/m.34110 type:complete len:85 (+) Transcript_18928:3034-3288(+)